MITARYRRAALVVALLALVPVLAMAVAFHDGVHGSAFDDAVDAWFVAHVPLDVARHLTTIGSGPVSGAATVILAAALVWRSHRRAAALMVLAPAVSIVLVELVIKPIVGRALIVPNVGRFAPAYPSGHTSGACSVAFALAVILLGPASPVAPRAARWITGAALTLAALCCLALVAAQYHYATDVIGSVFLCLAVVLLIALALTPGNGSPTDPGTPAGTASSAGTGHPPSRPSRPSPR